MDYVMSILYHSHKANVVVDDLSRLSMGSTTQYKKDKEELVKDMHRLARWQVRLIDYTKGGVAVINGVKLSLLLEV